MKTVALISLVGTAITVAIVMKGGDPSSRSMEPAEVTPAKPSGGFDSAQSVALFVGASRFTEDEELQMVPYAVDDAVDLAYAFALDPRVALVHPKRVALALSDPTPRKESSRRRLAELKRRGATIAAASQSQILKLLSRQAGTVGADGIFIVSFATHGFTDEGAQYLLAENSLLRERDTTIAAARVFDVMAASDARRSLVLIDACRERLKEHRGPPELRSAAPLIRRMADTEGQVVLYAAAAGKWAYDDDIRQNGVFTRAVLDGLECRAGHDRSGLVTVDALSTTVERSVLSWIRTNRDAFIRNATQASIDGAARTMPLAICARKPPPELPPVPENAIPPGPSGPISRTPLRPLLEECRDDGKVLMTLYDSDEPDRFVKAYIEWRDGCVAVLRDLDSRLPQRLSPVNETVRFLSIANFWCATKCPSSLSPANCALFTENPRAERCSWDLDKAVKQVDDILIRNAAVLRTGSAAQGEPK
jgi:hypothetical protein